MHALSLFKPARTPAACLVAAGGARRGDFGVAAEKIGSGPGA